MLRSLGQFAAAVLSIFAAAAPLRSQTTAVSSPTGTGVIHGRLADSASGRLIATASITIRRGTDAATVPARSREDGSFRIEGLAAGSYALTVRALGFAPLRRAGIVISTTAPDVDLGALKMAVVVATLEGEHVVGERAETVVSPDRTSYSTKNMTAAAGGTAVDVLRNIPSVEVDASNKVSLRGNESVIIQINGRATPLKGDQLGAFLAQLPANTVESVEVAPNPSAKDDPEGTAGIINIVLNQEVEHGLSGGINLGTSTTGMVNANGNVGNQKGKLSYFVSSGLYRDLRATSGTTSRANLDVPEPAFVETSLAGRQRPISGNMNLRAEYRFSDVSSLTLDSYAWGGRYGGDNASSSTDLDASRDVVGLFNQYTSNVSTNRGAEAAFTFRRQGKPVDPQFTAEVDMNASTSANIIDRSGDVVQADASTSAIPRERDHIDIPAKQIYAKADYAHPFSTSRKLETGFKGIARTTGNEFDAASPDGDGAYAPVASLANDFNNVDLIGGVYGLLSQRFGKVQLQTGLRAEDAGQHFTLRPSGQQFNHNYASLYPSAVLMATFSDMTSGKLSYSRRVSRPNPYQLSPLEYHIDARTIFHGNPNLVAEYTDAVEASLQETRGWGSAQLTTYARHTAHAVRNIQFVDSTGISVSTYDNVASATTVGTDLNVNAHRGPISVGGGGSVYHYASDASNLARNLSAHDIVWAGRLNTTYTMSPRLDAQAFAAYRAPYRTEGGSQLANVNMNLSLRYKAWGDRGAISLRVSDPFALATYGWRTTNGTVVEVAQRYYQQRALFLSISRNFGDALKLRAKENVETGDSSSQ